MFNDVPSWGGIEAFKYKVDLAKIDSQVFSFLSDQYLKENKEVIVLTFMSPEYIDLHGFLGGDIIGVMPANETEVDEKSFVQNQAFRELIQSLAIRADEPGLLNFITKNNPKMVAAIDRRANDPMGEVPSEDVLGVYEVTDKAISGFTPNVHYQFITEVGVSKFTVGIVEQLKKIYGNKT